MPSTNVIESPTGRINRRDNPNALSQGKVLSRINMMVVGIDKEKKVKKLLGSDRFNSTSVGSAGFTHAFRYYTKNDFRRTYAFSNGVLYHFDDLGNTSTALGIFSPQANPCSVQMRVSDVDIAYVSEGVNTGMYSYDGNVGNVFTKEIAVSLNFVGMISHLDRIFGFEEDSESLHFSKNLDPTNFTDSTDAGEIILGAKRGSKIQAIVLLNETLYIFKNDSIWSLTGKSPSEFSVQEVHPNLGTAARWSVQSVESGIMFLGSDFEFYSFEGSIASTKLLTYEIAMSGDFSTEISPLINKDRLEQIRSTYHNHIYRCSFNEYASSDIYNNMEYCFNTLNETDFLTRGNNVGCYLIYDRIPDKQELLTGRSDIGRMMHQYRGKNWDNQATDANMAYQTQTRFVGSGEAKNIRLRRTWLNSSVLSGRGLVPVRTYMDARTAASDSTTENFEGRGENKSAITSLFISAQSAITSRNIPRHANSKGQNFSFEINEQIADRELEFTSFEAEVILKNKKRSHRVGV